jgi:HK97 gp10 family phage protein
MEFTVKIEGLERIDRATQRVRDAVAREVGIALFASAKKVEGDANRSITEGQKSGLLYKRRTVTHRASAPGEAPASDTGRLVNSINGTVVSGRTGEAEVKAGSGIVRYARMLEFGTVKMAARPFLFPALEKNKAWIRERLNRAVRKAAVDAGRK